MPAVNKPILEIKYRCCINAVNNFVTGEETKDVVIAFKSIDGGKDVLKINCIIRVDRIISIKGVCRCIDYKVSVTGGLKYHQG
jgi:hypothetical protein